MGTRKRIVADATPETLGGRDQAAATVRFRLPAGLGADQLPAMQGAVLAVRGERVEIAGADLADLGVLVDWAREHGELLPGLTVERPSLEDVYLELTGGVR